MPKDRGPHPPKTGPPPAGAGDFEVAILAGGRSSRMGRDKARLKVGGRSLLAQIRGAARELAGSVRVIRRDDTPGCGPLGGVATALASTKAKVVLFLSCDMPAVTPALMRRVLQGFHRNTRAVFTRCAGRLGFPFALSASTRNTVDAQLEEHRFSLHQLAETLHARTISVPRRDTPQLVNLNTPAELATYRAQAAPPARTPTPRPALSESRRRTTGPGKGRKAASTRLLGVWIGLILSVCAASSPATTPPVEVWAPAQTLGYLTIPDASLARAEAARHGPATLWADPAMGPLRARFEERLEKRLLEPLRQVSGFHVGNLLTLAEGQITLVILDDPQRVAAGLSPEPVLVVDVGRRTNELAALFNAARNQPATNPAAIPTIVRIHDVDFLHVRIPGTGLDRVLDEAFPHVEHPGAAPIPNSPPADVFAGISGTCLVAFTTTNVIDGVLGRLSGSLARELRAPAFTAGAPGGARTLMRAWVSGPACVARLTGPGGPHVAGSVFGGFSPDRLATALGLKQVEAATFGIHSVAEGWLTEFRIAVPANSRRGLFKLLQPLAADASPPPWVPADILSFVRYRLAGPAAWINLQRVLQDIDPALLGVVQLLTEYAGRTEDVDFNFDRGLMAQLGNDWIATSRQVADTNVFGAGLIVHATTNAAVVHHALTLVASPAYLATFLPPDAPPPPRRQKSMAGGLVVSVGLPPFPWQDGTQHMLHLARRDDLVGMAGSERTIETFLTVTNAPSPLASAEAFTNALARAGGAQGGWVAYTHERETARHAFDLLGRSQGTLEESLRWTTFSDITTRAAAALLTWVPIDLLPAFDRVAEHFRFRVESGRALPDGLVLTTFRPSPTRPPLPVAPVK